VVELHLPETDGLCLIERLRARQVSSALLLLTAGVTVDTRWVGRNHLGTRLPRLLGHAPCTREGGMVCARVLARRGAANLLDCARALA
jgi:hypothetical protein